MPIVFIISSKLEMHLDGFLELYISPWITFVVLCANVKQSNDASKSTLDK